MLGAETTLYDAYNQFNNGIHPHEDEVDFYVRRANPFHVHIYRASDWVYLWTKHLSTEGIEHALIGAAAESNQYDSWDTACFYLPLINRSDEKFQEITQTVFASSDNSVSKSQWLDTTSFWLRFRPELISPTKKQSMIQFLMNEINFDNDDSSVQSAWLTLLTKADISKLPTEYWNWRDSYNHRKICDAIQFFDSNRPAAMKILTDYYFDHNVEKIMSNSEVKDELFSHIHSFLQHIPDNVYPLQKLRETEFVLEWLPVLLSRLPVTSEVCSEAVRWLMASRIQVRKLHAENFQAGDWNSWFYRIRDILQKNPHWVPPIHLVDQWESFESQFNTDLYADKATSWYQDGGYKLFEKITQSFIQSQYFLEIQIPTLMRDDHRKIALKHWHHISKYILKRSLSRNSEEICLINEHGFIPWAKEIQNYVQLSKLSNISWTDHYQNLSALLQIVQPYYKNAKVFWKICEDYGLIGKLAIDMRGNPLRLRASDDLLINTITSNQISDEIHKRRDKILLFLKKVEELPLEIRRPIFELYMESQDFETSLESELESEDDYTDDTDEVIGNETFIDLQKRLRDRSAKIRQILQQQDAANKSGSK